MQKITHLFLLLFCLFTVCKNHLSHRTYRLSQMTFCRTDKTMAVAGVDIMELMNGAMDAKEAYDLRSFDNPVWLYAAVRNLLYRNGKALEIFESFEPGFKMFGGWWQQLFGESEGKDGKGIFPATAELTADLHSLGQMIQQGQRNIFETMVRFAPPEKKMVIKGDDKNLDGLNYLEGKTLDFVDEKAYLGTLAAHVDGGVPVITMDCGELNDRIPRW